MLERRPPLLTALLWLAALALVVLAIGPALWLLLIALQPPGTDLSSVTGRPTLANFSAAVDSGTLSWPLVNSVLVTFGRAVLNVVLAALAAYPLAKMSFPGRNLIFVLMLATMMIPEQVIVVPMFISIVNMGLYDTLLAVIIPFSVSAFGIFLCRQAFTAIPDSLEEAARIDGATSLQIWWHVMLPLSAPTLATLALFSVIGAWSELLWPLIVLQQRENFTLPVAVNELIGQFASSPRTYYAASVLALIPILIGFVAMQRWLKPQMFAGAVKG